MGAYPDAVPITELDLAAYRRALRDLVLEGLEWTRERLPEGTETRAVAGDSAPRALLDAAEELDAGMLVLGSTHRGPVARIGAAFVDTPEGRNARAGAVSLARRAGASLEAITVIHPIGWGTMALPMATAIAREREHTRCAAEQALAHALAGLDPAFAAEPIVIEDGVPGALETMSSQLDVLVCGSRGYGPARMVLLGSVSRALSRHCRCPLIVLPRGSERELEELVLEPGRRARGAGDGAIRSQPPVAAGKPGCSTAAPAPASTVRWP